MEWRLNNVESQLHCHACLVASVIVSLAAAHYYYPFIMGLGSASSMTRVFVGIRVVFVVAHHGGPLTHDVWIEYGDHWSYLNGFHGTRYTRPGGAPGGRPRSGHAALNTRQHPIESSHIRVCACPPSALSSAGPQHALCARQVATAHRVYSTPASMSASAMFTVSPVLASAVVRACSPCKADLACEEEPICITPARRSASGQCSPPEMTTSFLALRAQSEAPFTSPRAWHTCTARRGTSTLLVFSI